jgi:hypothetical protein
MRYISNGQTKYPVTFANQNERPPLLGIQPCPDLAPLQAFMMKRLRFISLFALLTFGSLQWPVSQAVAQPGTTAVAKPAARTYGEEKALLVYPNPSTGIVHVAINGFEGRKLELRVLNVIGSVMYRETLTELNDRYVKVLDLSKFASGLYYIKLESEAGSEMRKLVIR